MYKMLLVLILLSTTIYSKQEAIILEDSYHKYIESQVIFDFYIVNINDIKSLSGEASMSDKNKFNIEFKIDKEYKSNGSEVKVIGFIKNVPIPSEKVDKYKLMISYSNISSQADMYIYNTINEIEITKLERQFMAFATYGTDFFFNFTPPSGRNLPQNQFGYYFKTNGNDHERDLIPGLKAERSDRLFFPPSATEATLKIVWINPISKEEITIFPEKKVKIRQTAPSISTNFTSENISGDDLLSCRISNIKLVAPSIGDDKLAAIDFSCEIDQVNVSNNYKIVGKPSFTLDDDKVTVDFKLMGESYAEGWVKGTVTLKMSAVAINPINNVKSDVIRKSYTFKINKKIENTKLFVNNKVISNNISELLKELKINKAFIYEIANTEEIKNILETKNNTLKENSINEDPKEFLDQVSTELKRLIEEGVTSEKTASQIQQDVILNGYDLPEENVFMTIFNYFLEIRNKTKMIEESEFKVYIISKNPLIKEGEKKDIVGLVSLYLPFENISPDINENSKYIELERLIKNEELTKYKIEKENYGYSNLFDLVNSYGINNLILRKEIKKSN